jgi:Mce-associated membrane protein
VNANWYDLLDVEPDASADEIRTAWRSAIEGMDPTERRFRVYNRAAETLLDADKRAAYDAELAAAEDAEEDLADANESEAEDSVADVTAAPEPELEPESETEAETGAETEAEPEAEPDSGAVVLEKGDRELAEDSDDEAEEAAGGTAPQTVRRPIPAWLLLVTALVTGLVVVAAVALWWFKPSDNAVADATSEAEAAAERATPVIFSYDYTRLDADHDATVGYLTSDYRKRYEPLFTVIKQNAPELQVKVQAQLVGSGIVRTGSGREADDRVQVFVLFNQVRTNKASTTPVTYPLFATLSMEKVGDEWLVDDVQGPPVLK